MITLLLLGLGIAMISIGIYRYKGPVCVWYLDYGPATVGHSYQGIPGGISLILLALATLPVVSDKWGMPLVFLAIAVTIFGLIFAPRLLKPAWLRWLEKEHGAILPILRQEIQKMGPEKWNRRINTQEELAEWINEVKMQRRRRAMGLDD